MKVEIILKPCPWCRKTPKTWLPLDNSDDPLNETWLWYIYCDNRKCEMRPRSPHVSIRKTTKTSLPRIMAKIAHLANRWNEGNPCEAYEKLIVDLSKIDFKNL